MVSQFHPGELVKFRTKPKISPNTIQRSNSTDVYVVDYQLSDDYVLLETDKPQNESIFLAKDLVHYKPNYSRLPAAVTLNHGRIPMDKGVSIKSTTPDAGHKEGMAVTAKGAKRMLPPTTDNAVQGSSKKSRHTALQQVTDPDLNMTIIEATNPAMANRQ